MSFGSYSWDLFQKRSQGPSHEPLFHQVAYSPSAHTTSSTHPGRRHTAGQGLESQRLENTFKITKINYHACTLPTLLAHHTSAREAMQSHPNTRDPQYKGSRCKESSQHMVKHRQIPESKREPQDQECFRKIYY